MIVRISIGESSPGFVIVVNLRIFIGHSPVFYSWSIDPLHSGSRTNSRDLH